MLNVYDNTVIIKYTTVNQSVNNTYTHTHTHTHTAHTYIIGWQKKEKKMNNSDF